MATTADDVWRLLGELAEAQKETERRFQETEHRFQETDRLIQQVSQQIGKLGNRLGEFVEWQVRPAAVRLFQQRGIAVHELYADISIQREDVRAMGAVAGMVVPEDVARYAYRRGLFVLAQSGDSVVILNDNAFEPAAW